MEEPHKKKIASFVEQDRLWKNRVRKEVMNQISLWPSKWSFLLDEHEKMHKAMEGKRPLSPDKTGEIWSRWHGGAIPTSPHLQMEPVKMTKARMKEAEKPQLPRIKDAPAETFLIPRTTNGWYGYKHQHNGHNLVSDWQYRWTRGEAYQHDLIKLLKWPMDYYD